MMRSTLRVLMAWSKLPELLRDDRSANLRIEKAETDGQAA